MGCLESKPAPNPPKADPSPTPVTTQPQPSTSSEPQITDKYTIGKVLGKGAFSVVKLATDKETGEKYALKCIQKKLLETEELELLQREIEIMQKLNHPNIIALRETLDTKSTLYLVLEFVPGGELFDAIVDKGNYSEQETADLVRQMLEAINYCHSQKIAHRDLKPENLLLKSKEPPLSLKIADFGLSKDFNDDQLKTACGTPDYVAPEVIGGEKYGKEVDIWSIGVITYVLLCGFPPFNEENQKELFDKIMNAQYDFPSPEWDEVSEEAKNFIRKILIVDPSKRYTAEQCLQDPWITQFTKKDSKKALPKNQSFSVKKFQEYQEKYKNAKPAKRDTHLDKSDDE